MLSLGATIVSSKASFSPWMGLRNAEANLQMNFLLNFNVDRLEDLARVIKCVVNKAIITASY